MTREQVESLKNDLRYTKEIDVVYGLLLFNAYAKNEMF